MKINTFIGSPTMVLPPQKAHGWEVPLFMVEKVWNDLHSCNYLFHAYECFAHYRPHETQVHMELSLANPGHGSEVAALYHIGSAPQPLPHSLYLHPNSTSFVWAITIPSIVPWRDKRLGIGHAGTKLDAVGKIIGWCLNEWNIACIMGTQADIHALLTANNLNLCLRIFIIGSCKLVYSSLLLEGWIK